ncbi:hypothetical protein KA025_02000 [Candidatus Saccharibacteria bacterium]|jgi:hypothetical protein|nr:hypothetical protein [Candidatus Saccharibacteria bacterium]MBP7834839.1 hypothetical protein [Candidatus Saccharibacteria bacterium]
MQLKKQNIKSSSAVILGTLGVTVASVVLIAVGYIGFRIYNFSSTCDEHSRMMEITSKNLELRLGSIVIGGYAPNKDFGAGVWNDDCIGGSNSVTGYASFNYNAPNLTTARNQIRKDVVVTAEKNVLFLDSSPGSPQTINGISEKFNDSYGDEFTVTYLLGTPFLCPLNRNGVNYCPDGLESINELGLNNAPIKGIKITYDKNVF